MHSLHVGCAHRRSAGILLVLQVVTGVGRHSVGGVARILPAVVRYLTEAGFNFSEEPNNPGLICVFLPGRRDAAPA